jgi:hypothetical protein
MIHHRTGVVGKKTAPLLQTGLSTFQNVDEVDHALFNYIHLRKVTHLCVVSPE